MKRIEVIEGLVNAATDKTIFVSSNGMISRELYQVKDRDLNFYMLGSMGMALAIGIGIAYTRPDLKVIVISGDGAVLMSLGTMILMNKLDLHNLHHIILDNNCHATTGGQDTCSDVIDFESLNKHTLSFKVDKDIGTAGRIPLTPKEITERFKNAINNLQ